jgi:hypothetical protein
MPPSAKPSKIRARYNVAALSTAAVAAVISDQATRIR